MSAASSRIAALCASRRGAEGGSLPKDRAGRESLRDGPAITPLTARIPTRVPPRRFSSANETAYPNWGTPTKERSVIIGH